VLIISQALIVAGILPKHESNANHRNKSCLPGRMLYPAGLVFDSLQIILVFGVEGPQPGLIPAGFVAGILAMSRITTPLQH
jgi:hypothetical protein